MDLITLALSKSYINKVKQELIDAGWKKTIVEQLPLVGDDKTIYLLQKEDAQGNVYYDEYLWTNGAYNAFGTTQTDMTNYYKKTETDSLLNGKVDKSDAVFNIRGYIDYDEHPYLYLWFSRYINGNLIEQPLIEDVFNITNSSVYLYRNTSNQWTLGFTSPGTYNGTPMLVGKIATKTVNGKSVKLFFRNGDDETQFDKLNSEKVDSDLLVPLTQSAYDNLPYINPDAYYFIEEE